MESSSSFLGEAIELTRLSPKEKILCLLNYYKEALDGADMSEEPYLTGRIDGLEEALLMFVEAETEL